MNYGEEPWQHVEAGDRVYILDFSFPRDIMLKLSDICEVTCLDHHKSAKEALLGLNCALFDMTKSGAMLAWEHWNPGVPAPDLIRYVQDRDLWHKTLPYTEEIYMGLREQTRTFENWDELANASDFVEQIRAIGEPLYQEKLKEVYAKADTVVLQEIAGYVVPVVADCSRYYSDVCYELLQRHSDAVFSVAWRDDERKNVRRWDFRSTGSFDVSAIASSFGGGGHQNAAGCQTEIGKVLWD